MHRMAKDIVRAGCTNAQLGPYCAVLSMGCIKCCILSVGLFVRSSVTCLKISSKLDSSRNILFSENIALDKNN